MYCFILKERLGQRAIGMKASSRITNLDQKGDGFPTIQQSVVIGKGQIHHRPYLDLSVHYDGFVVYRMKA